MDIPTIAIVALFCIVLGFILSSLVSSLREGKVAPAPKAAAAQDANLKVVVRVLRDRRSGLLVAEINGRKLHNAAQLNAGDHQRLAAVVSELRSWLGEASLQVEALPPVPSQRLIVPPEPTSAMPPARVIPISPRPLDALGKVLTSSSPQPVVFKSIASQIDELLQQRLAGTPLAGLKIRLVETPNQEVVVQVGAQQYEGVDAVPDEEIRSAIHQAVAEWEKRKA